METRESQLEALTQTVEELILLFDTLEDVDRMVYESWSARDILAHVTFWHESFARNVHDLVRGIKPSPLKGRYRDLADQCFNEFRPLEFAQIMARFKSAHKLIQAHITNPCIELIPYRIGSRAYRAEEHLEIVREHLKKHIKDIQTVIASSDR
jgi:hypothetical protein